jgi:hypothetical protein
MERPTATRFLESLAPNAYLTKISRSTEESSVKPTRSQSTRTFTEKYLFVVQFTDALRTAWHARDVRPHVSLGDMTPRDILTDPKTGSLYSGVVLNSGYLHITDISISALG